VPRPLVPTSYAVLGLLGNRPFPAYDLTKHTVRTIRLVWRSAESHLYAQLRRLTDAGLISARTEHQGRRPRTVHQITPAGRRALSEWLARPRGTEPLLEFEAMVQVLFAEQGTIADLRRTIAAIGSDAESMLTIGSLAAQEYLDGHGDFPERAHVNVLVWRYLIDVHQATADWATWATEHISAWDDVTPSTDRTRQAHQTWRDALQAGHRSGPPAPVRHPRVHQSDRR
jgi:PadR family transcriptional regulator, regulatory protein AphA